MRQLRLKLVSLTLDTVELGEVRSEVSVGLKSRQPVAQLVGLLQESEDRGERLSVVSGYRKVLQAVFQGIGGSTERPQVKQGGRGIQSYVKVAEPVLGLDDGY